MGSRVRALSVTHVRPTETTNTDDHTIKLSLFDTLFIALTPIRRLFFYHADDLPPFPVLVHTLRSSLAATLAVFPPLAGKVAVSGEDDVVIDCSPSTISHGGVRFVEAEYAGDLRRLAAAAEHDAEAYAQLAPALDVGKLPAPALAVQVTRGADGGGGTGAGAVVVGVSMNHVVADGQALWEFIRAWAAAARGGKSTAAGVTTPTFDRAAINRYPGAEEVARKFLRVFAPALPTVNTFPEPDNTIQGRRTYLLSASQIQSLKHCISQHSDTIPAAVKPPPTSTYAAVASLVWTSAVHAKNSLNHAGDDAYLVPVDLRRHLGSTIDERYFGNCVAPCYAVAAIGDLRDDGAGLARAAAAIVAGVRAGVRDDDPLGGAERWVERFMAVPKERLTHTGSSNRFMAYEVDFGWGRPSRVEELMSLFVRELVLLLGAGDGCVQVTVAMDHKIMEGFEANLFRVSSV
ncbi:hypothetical protein HU200_015201 [Digitaria exilis]|uniref:Uncharacterized protein n=1 Tax=Digitaria exilis TaxID=1010633 RepID=A0A835KJE5_9POAL|nr:hypothetical protein HU200_015201 [Digitaria exilis]